MEQAPDLVKTDMPDLSDHCLHCSHSNNNHKSTEMHNSHQQWTAFLYKEKLAYNEDT